LIDASKAAAREDWDAKERRFASVVQKSSRMQLARYKQGWTRGKLACDGGAIRAETASAAIIGSDDARGRVWRAFRAQASL
jgi:hypothetical protein